MYLSEIKIWNFRKFGITEKDGVQGPGVSIPFNETLNVLIGENDSGKTAIVDAIRLVLGTQSREWFYIDENDFHHDGKSRASAFKIECTFKGFTVEEAAPFLEWVDIIEQGEDEEPEYSLTVRLTARKTPERIGRELRAGSDPDGASLPSPAQDQLRIIYLKPLRDAESELTPGRKSRLAQILKAHPAFQKKDDAKHDLESIMEGANEQILDHFSKDGDKDAAELLETVNDYLSEFFPPSNSYSSSVKISGSSLHDILQRLSLLYDSEPPGLGSLNLLYIAAELLLLEAASNNGLSLTVIEEMEAHLHPQAQLRLIKHLQAETPGQLLLTTHSTTLASSLRLESLIICKEGKAFPMGSTYTKLEKKNYDFLERFLDATKSNLFFAKGVILVEGDAENILLPAIAESIGRPLHQYGASIVNVGSTAFLHYAKIFERKDGESMGVKVAVITDLDVKPLELQEGKSLDEIEEEKEAKHRMLQERYGSEAVAAFVSPNWTLEYEIALSKLGSLLLRSIFLAEKIQNSSMGDPSEAKIKKAIEEAEQEIAGFKLKYDGQPRAKAKAAKDIYYEFMLKGDKKTKGVSKAIVAQVFSKRLVKYRETSWKRVHNRLTTSPLKYLSDAICHVTAPLEEGADD